MCACMCVFDIQQKRGVPSTTQQLVVTTPVSIKPNKELILPWDEHSPRTHYQLYPSGGTSDYTVCINYICIHIYMHVLIIIITVAI